MRERGTRGTRGLPPQHATSHTLMPDARARYGAQVIAETCAGVPQAEAVVEAYMRAFELTSSSAPLGKLMTLIKVWGM